MTYDRGTEMALHETLSQAAPGHLFCDAHSPWQRGSNENANGLIREYLLKGMDLSRVTHQQLTAIEQSLNHRPRKMADSKLKCNTFNEINVRVDGTKVFKPEHRGAHAAWAVGCAGSEPEEDGR